MSRRLQAALALGCVAAGLAAQVLTRTAALEDIGIAAILVGLGALAVILPALLAEPSPRDADGAGGPPPPSPQ